LAVESSFDLDERQRQRTLYRLDGGAGTEPNMLWLLARGYQIVAKGFSGRRAQSLAVKVTRWDSYGVDAFVGAVSVPSPSGRFVQVVVKKWRNKENWQYSYYVSTLKLPSKQALLHYYDLRGGAEVEQFREDKSGLFLSARRKSKLNAQKALLLLTDLAHNLLADFRFRALSHSPFARWGLKRIIRDLLAMPGRLYFEGEQLKRIELQASHPNAPGLVKCLQNYCSRPFDE